jgi:hypothetical protein
MRLAHVKASLLSLNVFARRLPAMLTCACHPAPRFRIVAIDCSHLQLQMCSLLLCSNPAVNLQ